MQNPILIEDLSKQRQTELLKLAEEWRQAAQVMKATQPPSTPTRQSARREFHFLKWVIILAEARQPDPCLQELGDC